MERSEKDYAIEFGEYLAKDAEYFLSILNGITTRTFIDFGDHDNHTFNDAARGLKSAIYEFRKRAAKCAPRS